MKEEKKNNHLDKDYFINEELSSKKEVMPPARKFALGLCLAIFFGVIFSITYVISTAIIESVAEKKADKARGEISFKNEEFFEKAENPVKELYDKAKGSIVEIKVTAKKNDSLFSSAVDSQESFAGIIVGDDGNGYYILTSDSTINAGSEYEIIFPSGAIEKGSSVCTASQVKLGVLYAEYSGEPAQDFEGVYALDFAHDSAEIGDEVLLIGSPNGISGSIDYGMITSSGNIYYTAEHAFNLLSISTTVYENAAGVVVDKNGNICGVLTIMFGPENVTTAIDTSTLLSTLEYLINHGDLPYLGIICEDVGGDVLVQAGAEYGIYVSAVEAKSPAEAEGIRAGDIIISLYDERVDSVSEFTERLYSRTNHENDKIGIIRNGVEMSFSIKAGKEK